MKLDLAQPVCYVRWMIRNDLKRVLEIENDSFYHSWDMECFVNALRQRNIIGQVAEHDGQVVGYMVYELHKTSIVLLNLAVGRDYRRSGIGTQLVDRLIKKLSRQRRNSLKARVADFNLPAHLFFRSCGLYACKTESDFFMDQFGDTNDAYLFQIKV